MLHILQGEKMKGILEWVKQIACYMVLVTVLADLLPKKNYEKYFRLFAGLVLILLVIQPVTGPLKLDRQILKMFEGIQYEGMAGEFRQRASEMEEERFQKITEGYAGLIEDDIEAMARQEGAFGAEARVIIEQDPEKDGYGEIQAVQLTLWNKEESREAAAGVQAAEIAVEEITLDDSERTSEPGETVPVDPAGLKLRSQIADKYGLEEDHVEIQWEN